MKSKSWTRRFGLWFIYLHGVGNDQVLPVYLVVIFLSNEIAQRAGAELEILIWGGQVAALIYLSKQPPTYTYTHAFLLYTHFFIW